MRNPNQPEQNNELAHRLRGEAMADRPAFSKELHERICRAVEEARRNPPAVKPLRSASRRTAIVWLTVAAAACLALVTALSWKGLFVPAMPTAPAPADVAVDANADAPLAEVMTAVAQLPESAGDLADTLGKYRWGYLDHDLRLAVESLATRSPLASATALAGIDLEKVEY